LYRDMEERLKRIPGVRGAGLAMYNPLTDNWSELVLISGQPPPPPGAQAGASWDRVSTNYLQDLGVKLVRGRYFQESDNEKSENIAVVNEQFVKRFFKNGEDPIDKRFGLDLPELVNTFRIVGVVRDARFAGFQMDRPPRPMFYVPLAQTVKYDNPMMARLESQSHFIRGLLLVTDLPPATLEPMIKQTLAEADSNVTVILLRTLQEQVDRVFDQQRATASLAGLFGIVALVLAAIGLYGMTAYSVAQRTNEVGIRMALGAERRTVLGMVLWQGMTMAVAGLAAGAIAAVGLAHLLSSQLYDTSPVDPLAFASASAVLVAAALLACYIPARRATRVDPMIALRYE
jgi:predicted permease